MRSSAMSAALIVLCAVVSSATEAQQPDAARASALTALDYFQIQQLVARYARAIDTCSNNGYDYADLFTADGKFIAMFDGEPAAEIQGRERLAEVSGGGSRGCRDVPWIDQGVRHIYTNHVITPTPEGASGVVDMLMIGLGGDPNKIEYDGHYEDTYVRTPEGWRFKQRVHHALLREGERVTPAPGAQR
ncbi:MAG: nuclear transport factor 2 family protein [Gammaproteobacteria bacterium]|nr:nuclear transport factor 2 family protein [Gammaproteobacteria bacterium]